MLSIYQLMKYLRNTHHIQVKSSQTQALRNIGYYHGFKGYRFIRNAANRVNFSILSIVFRKFSFILNRLNHNTPVKLLARQGCLHGACP